MTISVQKVNPGDLITAASWNLVVDTLDSLQSQIDALVSSPPSTGGAPVITSTSPADVQAGSTLTINGRNFDVPAVLNAVTLGGTALGTFLPGSTDQLLLVQVPGTIPGPFPDTRQLVVTASGGTATASVHLVATVVPLIGAIKIKNASGTLPAPGIGDTIPFQFTLDASAVNIAEQYHLRVDFANAVGASLQAWVDGTTYAGLDGQQQVTVDPSTPVTVGVNVVVPAGATSVDMTVSAVSIHNDPASSSTHLAVPIVVGQSGPAADPSIHLEFGTNASQLIHAQDYTGTVSGSGLAVKYGTNPIVEISLRTDNAGTYTIDGQVEGDASPPLWALTGLPQDMPFTAGQGQFVHFNLHLLPTGPVTGVDVTRYLMVTATRRETSGVGQISNYFRFPVGGF